MKKLLLILLVILCFSCKVLKKEALTDNSTINTVKEVVERVRKSDTITIEVPNIIYKDTVITKVNYETKTIARITYDNQGNQRFDCIPAEISERLERIEIAQQNNITNKIEKQNSFQPQKLFYAIAALALIIIIGLGFLGFMILRIQKQTPQLMAGIIKQVIN